MNSSTVINSQRSKLIYDVNERPPITKLLLLSFQHVFAMFGSTILVPILVNGMIHAFLKFYY